MLPLETDYLIVGGGFYGICIALHLREKFPTADITLLERESKLMSRASYSNQARVHNGYHYPRSFVTAYRSRINLPRFCQDFPFAVKKDFTKLYAIAKQNSKVNSLQFVRFCKEIGAKIAPAQKQHKQFFNMNLFEEIFEVEEYAFDSSEISDWATSKLQDATINIKLNTVFSNEFEAKYVFNATYSGLNTVTKTSATLKHEITEMALIEPPKGLKNIGITVMDGPFFSMMPFPPRNLHTLSHVRYTPHMSWIDEGKENPYDVLTNYSKVTRYDRMLRDVRRYLPMMDEAQYKNSLFEVKTVLTKNEGNDGRPILFESSPIRRNFYSILGGKIDNIYDILDRIDEIL